MTIDYLSQAIDAWQASFKSLLSDPEIDHFIFDFQQIPFALAISKMSMEEVDEALKLKSSIDWHSVETLYDFRREWQKSMADKIERESKDQCIEFQWPKSPHSLFLSNELVKSLGGAETLMEHLCSDLSLMPRRSSRQRPWTPLDWELFQRNVALGKRHWKYNPNCIVGNTRYHGYGHETDKGFQFYDWNPERPHGRPIDGRKTY